MTCMTSAPASDTTPRRVVIAGGGVGALEALMALRDLGGDAVAITLVAPAEDFVLRAMSVAVPFSAGHVTRVPLADVCREFGAERRAAAVASVDPEARRVRLADGEELPYDTLILATGADEAPALADALTFDDRDPAALSGLLRDVEQGYTPSVAVVVPPGASWALPAYELALMVARHAHASGFAELPVHLVTPEPAPLVIFGAAASAAVARLLAEAGVTLHTGARAAVERGRIQLGDGAEPLEVARVVALPLVVGRPIDGVPAGPDGFIPVDDHARVPGLTDVFAVGDGADFPVKQGGLAAQQADAAATTVLAAAGAPVAAEPFRPILRGVLLTGGRPRYLSGEDGAPGAEASTEPLWWPPAKVVGRYLAPWLAQRTGVGLEPPPAHAPDAAVTVEAELPRGRDADPLAISPLGELPPKGRW